MRIVSIAFALIIAITYYFVWPDWKDPQLVKRRSLAPKIILRWFHSFTWILLAATCFLWSKSTAALAGIVYLIFMLTLVLERMSHKQRT
jgi:hypothetical protein